MEHQDQPGQSDAGTDVKPEAEASMTKKSKHGPRKRVSQACDKCRSRKDKCDGKKPACSTCTINGRQCSYDANVKKRGLPEGYVRGLEKLWGLAIKEIDGVEDNILLVVSSGDGDETFLDTWNNESSSENLVETWRKSQISRELEKLLSIPEQPSESGKRKRTESDSNAEKRIGTIGISSTSVVRPGNQNELSKATWPEARTDMRSHEFLHSPRSSRVYESDQILNRGYESILSPSHYQRASSSNPPALTTDAPELPSEAWHLLDVYFSYTHSWLPIIEKHDLLRISYQYSENRNNLSPSGNGIGDHAVLWATIAYAKYQHRAINNIPHAQGPVADMVWTAERMYAQARSLIPSEEGDFELGHVQALLILAVANLGIGHSSRAWLLVGQAVRIAFDLGLNKSTDDILAPLKTKSRNKHVFLGCFAIDTIIAARLERRPHIRAEDVDHIGLIEEDGLEEWDPWMDCLSARRKNAANNRAPALILSTFNRLVKVLQILNEAICIPDSPKKVQLSTALLEKLHLWSLAQSSPLYFDSTAMKSEQAISLLPHHYHLHLSYFNTLLKVQLLAYNHGNESSNLEPSARSADHITLLLKQHLNYFGPLIVPPVFEYFIKTAYDVVRELNKSIENRHTILNNWRHNLDYCLESMEPAWPVFESLKDSVSTRSSQPIASGRRASQVAFDLINGISQVAEVPKVVKTPNSLASYEVKSPRVSGTTLTDIINSPHSINNLEMRSSSMSHRNASFGQSLGQELLTNFQQSPQIPFNPSSDAWSIQGQNQGSQVVPPRPPHSRSFGPEFELDPMFQEFATLDATRWATNWDQSLANLGFTDPDNMNQDFYKMSREPDPLFPNTVLQQLVANSNAEATDFFDGSTFGMGLGGFGGMGFGDESEGIEAGQILQALSAAEDQRHVRSNG